MKMHFPKKLAVTAVMAAMGVAVSGTASAYEYAMSHLNIQNFTIEFNPPGNFADTFTFDLTNTASLNGVNTIQSDSCGGSVTSNDCGVSPVLDPIAAEIPDGIRGGENVYTFVGPSTTTSYGSSDSVIRTAELTSGSPTSAESIAEVNVDLNGNARANAELQSNTSLEYTGLLAGTFDMTFEADPDLRALIDSLPGTHSAQANVTASFSLTSNTDDSIFLSWSPQGTAGTNDCTVSAAAAAAGITCVELNDAIDLNRNLATTLNPSDIQHSYDVADIFGLFGIRVSGLPEDVYALALNTVTSGNVRSLVVPEPASLALLGLGLLGMGVGLRRRNRHV